MNKLILGGLGVVIVGLIAWGMLSAPGTVTATITTDKALYDFGEIDIFGGKVETEFLLTNTGAEDVRVTSAETSCMCTEGKIDEFTFGMHGSTGKTVVIPAGETKTLTAIFDPLAHGPEGTGGIKRDLFLKTNSDTTPEVRLQFSGNVVKNITEAKDGEGDEANF
jgi:hypothetical protein